MVKNEDSGRAFRHNWDLSVGRIYTPELTFTPELEPSTVYYKHQLVVRLANDFIKPLTCAPGVSE